MNQSSIYACLAHFSSMIYLLEMVDFPIASPFDRRCRCWAQLLPAQLWQGWWWLARPAQKKAARWCVWLRSCSGWWMVGDGKAWFTNFFHICKMKVIKENLICKSWMFHIYVNLLESKQWKWAFYSQDSMSPGIFHRSHEMHLHSHLDSFFVSHFVKFVYIYIYLFIIFHIFPSFHPVRYICIYIYIHPMSSTSPHNSKIFGDSIVRRNLSLVASLVASQLLLARTADGRECMAGADLRWVFEVCQKFGNWNFETFFWCYPVTCVFFLTQIGFWPTAMRIFTTKPGV